MSNYKMECTLVPIPPPLEAPFYQDSQDVGVLSCLRMDLSKSQWRCTERFKMQPVGTKGFWVPDGLSRSDPEWAFIESARTSAFNGHSSKWCFKCVPKSHANIGDTVSYEMNFASYVAALFLAGLFIGIVIASIN